MTSADPGWLRLSSAEFFLVWSAMGLGELPLVLGIPRVGRTRGSRDALAEEASRSLAARGLGTVREPAYEVATVLRLIAEHETALDMRVHGPDSSLLAFAGLGPKGAVAVGRMGEEVRAGAIRREALASTLVATLRPMPAGPGRPANVLAADFDSACAEGERDGVTGFVRMLRAAGVRIPETDTVTQAVTGRRGGGQLGASGRGRDGRSVRSPATVNWVDTADGRYAMRRSGGWLTVTPADPARLVTMTEEMLNRIRDPRRLA